MPEQEEEKVITAIYIKKSVKKNAKLYALKNATSLSELIEKALMAFLPFYQKKA